ncbi:MAG: hypothetical protein K5893_09155 [Prevotella sp.]|nr:hypothetical protein [Prevotella sp.]
MELFDSLALNFNADSISVNQTEKENEFTVGFGNGADITVVRDGEGNMKVTSSHGLLAFDEQTVGFAKKTGQWKDGLTDVELAKRMSDKDFETTLVANVEKEFAKNLTVVHEIPSSDYFASKRESIYTVKNKSSKQIDGDDYQLIIPFFREHSMGDMNVDRWNETRKGKTISPNGSVTYVEYIVTEEGEYERTGPVYDGHRIELTLKGKALFNKYYEAKGDEYEKYLKEKESPAK